jgi:hypothetical protein
MKESDIQKQISDYLKLKGWILFKHRNVGIYKKATGKYIPLPYGEKGISDLIGCSPTGQFGAFEVKMKGGKPSSSLHVTTIPTISLSEVSPLLPQQAQPAAAMCSFPAIQ